MMLANRCTTRVTHLSQSMVIKYLRRSMHDTAVVIRHSAVRTAQMYESGSVKFCVTSKYHHTDMDAHLVECRAVTVLDVGG